MSDTRSNPLIPALLETIALAHSRHQTLQDTRELLCAALDLLNEQQATIDRLREQMRRRFDDGDRQLVDDMDEDPS